MSTPDLDQGSAQAYDDALTDEYVRRRFGVEATEDRSGLFGQPTTAPGEPDEDTLFETYMERHFPQVAE